MCCYLHDCCVLTAHEPQGDGGGCEPEGVILALTHTSQMTEAGSLASLEI